MPKSYYLKRIAERVLEGLRVSRGDVVLIASSSSSSALADELCVSALEKGAVPLVVYKPPPSAVRAAVRAERTCIGLWETLGREVTAFVDVIDLNRLELGLGELEAARAFWNLLPYPVFDEIARRKREGRRYALLTSPLVGGGLDEEVARASLVDGKLLYAKVRELASHLERGRTVRIASKGTYVEFKLAGRKCLWDCGTLDLAPEGDFQIAIPPGVVGVFPEEGTAEGRLLVPEVYDPWMAFAKPVKNLELVFERGRVVEAGAEEGLDVYEAVLAASTGHRDWLCEFGIGLNPEVEGPRGFQQLDEVAEGLVYVAIGDNSFVYPELGGRLSSNLHWHLPIPRATVEVDGRTVVEDGRIVV